MKADMVSLPSPKRKETGKGRKQGAVSRPDVSVSFFSGLITEDDIRSPTSLITSPVITLPDYLHQSGRKLHPVKGDGNCMFRSLSNHLLGNEEEHDAVRTLLIRFENLNHHYFEAFLMDKNEPTLKAYISKMCQPSTWGTQIEIEAAACLFQVPVYECLQSQDGEANHWEVHHPRAPADQFRHPTILKMIQSILQSFLITLSLPTRGTVTMTA